MGVARVEPIKGWAIEGETKWIAIGVRRIQFDWVDVRHCQGSQSTRRGLRDVAGEQGFAGTPFVDVRRSVERAQPCVIFTPRGVRRAHGWVGGYRGSERSQSENGGANGSGPQ